MTNDKMEIIEGEIIEVDEIEDAPEVEVVKMLNKDAAEQLTKDIKSTTTALYVLIKRAHDTKAWLSLGYKTWTEYIEREFDFSRARSYQLINQANVIEEINQASGVPLYLTEREARSIKNRLPEITEKLKEIKEADLSPEDAEEKTKEIIEESKEEIDNSKSSSNNDTDTFENEEEKEHSNYDDNEIDNFLTEDDKFYYENLLVTLKIFDSMPNPSLLGEKVMKSKEEKKELLKIAEKAHEWIDKFMKQIKNERGNNV